MPGSPRISRISLLCVVAVLATATVHAGDVARVMPADTVFYVGWSKWMERDSRDLEFQRSALEAVAENIAGLGDNGAGESTAESAFIKFVLDVAEPLQTGSAGLGVFDVTLVDGQPDIQAALVVDGPDAPRLADTLRSFIASLDDPDRVEQHTLKDVTLACTPLSDTGLNVVWGVHQQQFILALGDAAAGKVIDCINGDAPNLASEPEVQFDRAKVTARLDDSFFCLYVDVQRFVTRAKELAAELAGPLPPSVDLVLEELGITSIRSKYLQIDSLDGHPRFAAFAHVDGPIRGLLTLWNQEVLTDADIAIVPKDAYWARIGNWDLDATWKESLRVLDRLAPDVVPAVEGALAMAGELTGISITDELLPALGDTWAMFDAPDHGGILLLGSVLVGEIHDAEAVQAALGRLVQMVGALAMQWDVTLAIKQTTHGDHTINYVLIGGVPAPVAPAWGFVNNRCVFGLYPPTVATAMQQVDSTTRGESLLDHPDYQAARAHLPKYVQGVGYFNSRYFTRMFYPFMNAIQTAGVSMLGKEGMEIDLALIPPLPEQAAEVHNLVGTVSRDDDGVYLAAVGDGTPLAMTAAGTAALAVSILLPSLAEARHQAKAVTSMANLRQIGEACTTYAMEDQGGRLPDSLQQMLEAGLITRATLQSPFSPEPGKAYEYISGQAVDGSLETMLANVVAYERLDHADRALVLFMDGHVEKVGMERFRTLVRDTYRRLGRESELPPEFHAAPTSPDVPQ